MASSVPPTAPASASPERRLLILAEGHSADPHFGKTARGVLRYRPEQVVAVLDSKRAGETEEGVPIVGSVDDALGFNPTTALVGVATQGGRFPPAWRELLKNAIAKGLDLESGLHEFVSDDPELAELARRFGVELHERLALPARPAQVAAIALNTRDLDEDAARTAIARAEDETGLPADDPVRFGAGRITSFVLETVAETR